MRLSAWHCIFYLTIVSACGYANAGRIAKRASEDDATLSKYINKLIDATRSLPVIGMDLAGIMEWTVQAISLFEIGTNGALARLLGGALPCEVTLEGTTCTGLTSNGGFGKVLMDVVNDVPGFLLPALFKFFIGVGIQLFIDPTVDVLLGGVVIPSD